MSLNELSNKYASIPEGINTVQAIKKLIDTNNLNLPVCLRTYDILFEGKAFKCLLDSIISQPIDYE